jgi:hypothetical protein
MKRQRASSQNGMKKQSGCGESLIYARRPGVAHASQYELLLLVFSIFLNKFIAHFPTKKSKYSFLNTLFTFALGIKTNTLIIILYCLSVGSILS